MGGCYFALPFFYNKLANSTLEKTQLKNILGASEMKDIFEILKGHDIEVPEDKVAEIKKAVSENYKTVNEFNSKVTKLDEQLTTANTTINDLNAKIKDFENVDVKGLQDTIKKYEDAETTRKEAETKANALQALKDRFSPLKGEKKYLNEGTEQWIFAEFEKAIGLEENKSKSDSEIYDAITKDKNIYENPNSKYVNPSAGGGSEQKTEFKRFF